MNLVSMYHSMLQTNSIVDETPDGSCNLSATVSGPQSLTVPLQISCRMHEQERI